MSKAILFISTQLPYPPKSGGTVKSWNYVKHLSSKHQLSVACLLKDDDHLHVEEFKAQLPLSDFYGKYLHVKRSPLNLIKSYFKSACLNVYRNYSLDFKNHIDEKVDQYDLIIVDHYEMFQYVPLTYKGKVVMHTHNAEFMLWQRMGELSSNFFKKLVLKMESIRVSNYEKYIFEKSDLIYSTPSDIELYAQHRFDIDKHRVTYHLGNDDLLDLPALDFEVTENALTFMGTLNWEPNVDGLVWFIDKVWPLIRTEQNHVKLYVLGKDPDQRIINAIGNDKGVILTGFVKNLDDYLKKTRVYIAPLRFGSGMKVKVLEGLYRGVPTVSTTVGVEGLEVENEKHLFVNDDEYQFAQYCLKLLNDKLVWESLSRESRSIADKKYRWKDLFKRMDDDLQELLK